MTKGFTPLLSQRSQSNIKTEKGEAVLTATPFDYRKSIRQKVTGFTLLELLIVIGILAVLATLAILVLNPAELLRQGRDTQRVNDLASVNKALSFLQADQPDANFGTASTTYISLPDTDDANPPDCDEYSLPALPSGWSYYCALKSNYRKTDGTGWIPVNFTSLFATGAPFSQLPVDPVNSVTNGQYYTYVTGGSWELTAKVEAVKNKKGGAADKDGGVSSLALEIGSNLSLTPADVIGRGSTYDELTNYESAMAGYWKFDEGSGTTAADASGNNNIGTLRNGPAWQVASSCKVGFCLSFDGVDDRVDTVNNGSLNLRNVFTVAVWIKAISIPSDYRTVFSNVSAVTQSRINLNPSQVYVNAQDDSGQGAISSSGFTPQVDTWYYITLTFDKDVGANNIKLYLNGSLNSANTLSGPRADGGGVMIGTAGPSYQQFNGYLDDIRVYNRALSAAEIKAIYDATK